MVQFNLRVISVFMSMPAVSAKKILDNNNFAGTEWTDMDKKTWTL